MGKGEKKKKMAQNPFDIRGVDAVATEHAGGADGLPLNAANVQLAKDAFSKAITPDIVRAATGQTGKAAVSAYRDAAVGQMTGVIRMLKTEPLASAARTLRREYFASLDRRRDTTRGTLPNLRFWEAVIQLGLAPGTFFRVPKGDVGGRTETRLSQNKILRSMKPDFFQWKAMYPELVQRARARPDTLGYAADPAALTEAVHPDMVLIPLYLDYLYDLVVLWQSVNAGPAVTRRVAQQAYDATLRDCINQLAGPGLDLRTAYLGGRADAGQDDLWYSFTARLADRLGFPANRRITPLPLPNELFYQAVGINTAKLVVDHSIVIPRVHHMTLISQLCPGLEEAEFWCSYEPFKPMAIFTPAQMPPLCTTLKLRNLALHTKHFTTGTPATPDYGLRMAAMARDSNVQKLTLEGLLSEDHIPLRGEYVQYIISAYAPRCTVLSLRDVELPAPRVWLQRAAVNQVAPFTSKAKPNPVSATDPEGVYAALRSIGGQGRYYWFRPMIDLAPVTEDDRLERGAVPKAPLQALVLRDCRRADWIDQVARELYADPARAAQKPHKYCSGLDIEIFLVAHRVLLENNLRNLVLRGEAMFLVTPQLRAGGLNGLRALRGLTLDGLARLRYLPAALTLSNLQQVRIKGCPNIRPAKKKSPDLDRFTYGLLQERRNRQAGYLQELQLSQLSGGAEPRAPRPLDIQYVETPAGGAMQVTTGTPEWQQSVLKAYEQIQRDAEREQRVEQRRAAELQARQEAATQRTRREIDALRQQRERADATRRLLQQEFFAPFRAMFDDEAAAEDERWDWPDSYKWVERAVYWARAIEDPTKDRMELLLDWLQSTFRAPGTRTDLTIETFSEEDPRTVQPSADDDPLQYSIAYDEPLRLEGYRNVRGFTWSRPARLVKPTLHPDTEQRHLADYAVLVTDEDLPIKFHEQGTIYDAATGALYRSEVGLDEAVQVRAGTFTCDAESGTCSFASTLEELLCVTGAQCISALIVGPLGAQRKKKKRERNPNPLSYKPWPWELYASPDAGYLMPLRARLWTMFVDLRGNVEQADYIAAMDNVMSLYFLVRLSIAEFMRVYGRLLAVNEMLAVGELLTWLDTSGPNRPGNLMPCTTYALTHSQSPASIEAYAGAPEIAQDAYVVPETTRVVRRLSNTLFLSEASARAYEVMLDQMDEALQMDVAQRRFFDSELLAALRHRRRSALAARRGDVLISPESPPGDRFDLVPVFGALNAVSEAEEGEEEEEGAQEEEDTSEAPPGPMQITSYDDAPAISVYQPAEDEGLLKRRRNYTVADYADLSGVPLEVPEDIERDAAMQLVPRALETITSLNTVARQLVSTFVVQPDAGGEQITSETRVQALEYAAQLEGVIARVSITAESARALSRASGPDATLEAAAADLYTISDDLERRLAAYTRLAQ